MTYSCAVYTGSSKPFCWGATGQGVEVETKAAKPSKKILWNPSKTCLDWHTDVRGSTGCTTCTNNCKHVVIDPKKSSGLCINLDANADGKVTPQEIRDKRACPMCLPKDCCSPLDKHYVLNPGKWMMTGVCLRESDDCRIVCEPKTSTPTFLTLPQKATKANYLSEVKRIARIGRRPELILPTRRSCTKGCNKLSKVPKGVATVDSMGRALPDKDTMDIVICQANHRVLCEYHKWVFHGAKKLEAKFVCKVVKSVLPVAKCTGFEPSLWDAGGTCIEALANKDPNAANHCTRRFPQGAPQWLTKLIRAKCKPIAQGSKEAKRELANPMSCGAYTLPWAEYY
jgi:hypothetical protein